MNTPNLPKINLVIALPCEARPWIDEYRLKLLSDHRFPIYQNKDQSISLIVSGVGRVKAAAATSYLFMLNHAGPYQTFLNLGIAGGRAEQGAVVLANKLPGVGYPFLSSSHQLKTGSLLTVDKPIDSLPDGVDFVDMEAAGFFEAATQLVTREQVQVVKVISDDNQDFSHIKPAFVTSLIRDAISQIKPVIDSLLDLSARERELLPDGALYETLLKRHHFTQYQKHELKSLVRRFQVLFPNRQLEESSSAEEALLLLKQCRQDGVDAGSSAFAEDDVKGGAEDDRKLIRHIDASLRDSDTSLRHNDLSFRHSREGGNPEVTKKQTSRNNRKLIYIEEEIQNHSRVTSILKRFESNAEIILCKHYKEIFNPKSQNFRIQKQNPAIILAKKAGRLALPTPEGFGIGGQQNFYFSHMLNCLYDCRYCFLQGMYPSAHHVIFVNYEDFMGEIAAISKQHENSYFFSGYDCDSLAYEPVTGFLNAFIPFFKAEKNAILELRTKSSNIRELLKHEAIDNCVVAYSFTPQEISNRVEHGVPSIDKRLQAMRRLAERGWKLGLRFDPLIYSQQFETQYQLLIQEIFQNISPNNLHSISVGPLRFPEKMYQKISGLYPKDVLFAQDFIKRNNQRSYSKECEEEMKAFVIKCLNQYVEKPKIFECHVL
ncbi:MAG: spore photoproduct lyase family protein [Gammaproteobacteria bacterium]